MIDANALGAEGAIRISIARRVADAHRGIDDTSLLAFVSGSTVDEISDSMSDVDMSVIFAILPDEEVLRNACRSVGSSDWSWSSGDARGGLVVSFDVDRVEVQIGYDSQANLRADMEDLLVAHNPDTPNHKLAEGILKAFPLAGADRLAALQGQLADFPAELGRAMVVHGLIPQVPWRAVAQLLQRDAALWCRDLQVDGRYRVLLILCGLNRRYFTRFQLKRTHRLAASLPIAPSRLADRIDALLAAAPHEAFAALHSLEGEVIELVERHMPDVDLVLTRELWSTYQRS